MKKKKMYLLFLLLIFFIAVTASCGGGGGGGDGDGGGPGPGPGPVSGSHLFYFDSNGGLYAVDPSVPTHPVTVESSGTMQWEYESIFSGTWDAANRQLTNAYLRYTIYIKDAKIYKVSALRSEGLAKSQISNETGITGTGAGSVCDSSTAFDWSNPENSRFLYTLAGTDTLCGTPDDVKRVVRLGMSSTDTPLNIPAGIERVNHLMDRSNGAIFGWLVRNTATLKLQGCDADFGSCIDTPPTSVLNAGHLGSDFSSNTESVWYYDGTNTHVCIYDFVTSIGSCPLVFAGNNIKDYEKDSTGVYIAYQGVANYEISKVGFNSIATSVGSDVNAINEIVLTDNRVVYLINDGINYIMKSVPKAGGVTVTLITKPNMWWNILTNGNRVFYAGDDGAAHFFAGYVLDDNPASAYEVLDAMWSYFILAPALTNNDSNLPSLSRVVRTDGCAYASFSCANGAMISFDAGTYSSAASGITIGTVPSSLDVIGLEGGIGIGNDALPVGLDSSQVDIFYFKADAVNSLQRITNTPAVNEIPVFFF